MIGTTYGLANAGQIDATGTPDLMQPTMIDCHPTVTIQIQVCSRSQG